jgi:serine/threonine-protein kinase
MTVGVGDLVAGKYRLIELLGTGGWGKVYSGENVRTLHKVAIKLLHPEMAARREMSHRFEREAQAAGKIGSDHIIEVFDLGDLPDGSHYMVMELLDGEDLSTRFKTVGAMDPVLLAPIVAQVLDGLAAAHEAGILHRDLKPENLFLVRTRTGDDFVKILDFGISKFREAPKDMTVSGAVMGSPSYMSPEQARGSKDVDVRSDLYSIGVVLFEGVTGTLPFEGDNFNELLFKIALSETPPDPCAVRPDLDSEFGAIIRKTLNRDPALRWQTASELGRAVTAWMETKGLTREEAALIRRARNTPVSAPSVRIGSGEGAQGNAATVAVPSGPRLPDEGSSRPDVSALPRSHSAEVQVLSAPPRASVVKRRSNRRLLAFAIAIVGLTVAAVALNLTRANDTGVAAQGDPPLRPPVEQSAQVVALPPPLEPAVVEPAASVSAVAIKPPPPATATTTGKVPVRPVASIASGAASSAASAHPAASSAASAKAVGTVEGRQIRTGL